MVKNQNFKMTNMFEPDSDPIKILLENGANPNIKANNGQTALMLLCELRHDSDNEIIKILLENGADINLKNASRCTVLTNLMNKQNLEIIKLLLLYGATKRIKELEGELNYYKTSLELHSDGEYILELKKKFL